MSEPGLITRARNLFGEEMAANIAGALKMVDEGVGPNSPRWLIELVEATIQWFEDACDLRENTS